MEMRNIRKAAVALFGLLVFVQVAPARAEECQLKLITSLDMIENPSGLLLIPVTIAGTQRVMVLSTAGYASTLSKSIADELNLKQQKISSNVAVYGVNGTKFEHFVTAPSFQLGSAEAKDLKFLVSDSDDKVIAGSIAPDVLENFDVDLDFAKKKVNLFSQDHCKGQVVYWARHYLSIPMKFSPDNHIKIDVVLDDHVLDASFSTGSCRSTLSLRIAQGLFNIDTESANVRRLSAADSPPYYQTSFKNLQLQGLSVPNPTIDLIPDGVRQRARQDMPDKDQNQPGTVLPHMSQLLLGLDVIHQLHVYIAYKERVLYVTAADAH